MVGTSKESTFFIFASCKPLISYFLWVSTVLYWRPRRLRAGGGVGVCVGGECVEDVWDGCGVCGCMCEFQVVQDSFREIYGNKIITNVMRTFKNLSLAC